jgi:DNA repair protein RadC
MNVKLTNAQKIKLASSADIYKIMQQVLLRENKIDRHKEHFWTIGLDNANRILYIELISLGTTTSVQVEPMQVYRVAILKGAIRMVLVHNHPSGEIKPSDGDITITDRLIQVGKIVGITVLDHLIISEKTYNSLGDTGELKKIEQSTLFMPDYKQKAQLKKEAADTARQQEKKQIAKQLKENGFTVSQIVMLTGISPEEAEKIKVKKNPGSSK